jgi:hypothetical protein
MPALFLNLLKLIFIALIYLFLWQIGRSIGAHIGPAPSSRPARKLTELVAVRSATLSGLRFPLGSRVTVPTRLGKGDSIQIGKTILEVR